MINLSKLFGVPAIVFAARQVLAFFSEMRYNVIQKLDLRVDIWK